jgi:hypothetical protein
MTTIANATVAIATLMALLCFFYGPWQRASEDLARQFLFEQRARLFLLACEGKLSFDSPSYKNARLMLNAYLRFAHDLSWPRLLYLVWMDSQDAPGFGPELDASIRQIETPETRKLVEEILRHSVAGLIFMMMMKSIIFAIPATLAMFISFCTHIFSGPVKERIQNEKSVVRKISLNIQAQAAQQHAFAEAA